MYYTEVKNRLSKGMMEGIVKMINSTSQIQIMAGHIHDCYLDKIIDLTQANCKSTFT